MCPPIDESIASGVGLRDGKARWAHVVLRTAISHGIFA